MNQKKNALNKLLFFSFLVGIFFISIFYINDFFNNRLFLFEAESLWGSTQFNEVDFRNGSTVTRASMAVDLIRSEKYLGEKCESIPDRLGDKNGNYYYSDSNSTYMLTEKTSENWILTFICGEVGVIRKVIIRKSCCSYSKKMLHWGVENIERLFSKEAKKIKK